MLILIARRLISGIGALLVVSVVTFLLLFLSSGNVARNILGDQATEEAVAAKTYRDSGLVVKPI